MDYVDLKHKLDNYYFAIIRCKPEHRLDLKRMWATCMEIRNEMSKEDVNCRRKGKETAKMTELTAKLAESLNTLEQYLMWAKLLE